MKYQYEILRLEPKNEFISIRYSSEGLSDFFFNQVPRDFSPENIDRLIKKGGQLAVDFWTRSQEHPESVDVPSSGTGEASEGGTPDPEIPERPEYDPFTQYIELSESETDDGLQVEWVIHDMTEEQQQEVLADWRQKAVITPRQARLALLNEGKLSALEEAFAELPQDTKQQVEIEWEYASVIERESQWVQQIGPLLGYTDQDLDNLFLAAQQI